MGKRSASWKCKTFLLSLPCLKTTNQTLIHGQKYPIWSCRTHHHIPRDPGRPLLNCASKNKQTDLNKCSGFSRISKPDPSPLGMVRENTWTVVVWADMHRWEEICRRPACLKGDNSKSSQWEERFQQAIKFGCSGEGGTCWESPLPGWHCMELVVAMSPVENVENGECLASPVVWVIAGKTCFSSAAPKVLKQDIHDLGRRKEKGKEASKNTNAY